VLIPAFVKSIQLRIRQLRIFQLQMKKENIILEKSYCFALRIVKLPQYLVSEKKEFVISRQILKSGTSIGANTEEAMGGQSEKDFYAKMTIAYKEARETKYWLRLLRDSQTIDVDLSISLLNDIEEILKIIGKIQTTIRNKRLSDS
jgi:four helix bundle protein